MTGSRIRERRQKKVEIELRYGHNGQKAELTLSLAKKEVRMLNFAANYSCFLGLISCSMPLSAPSIPYLLLGHIVQHMLSVLERPCCPLRAP